MRDERIESLLSRAARDERHCSEGSSHNYFVVERRKVTGIECNKLMNCFCFKYHLYTV